MVKNYKILGIREVENAAEDAYDIVPSDTADLPNGVTKAIYVGGSGDLRVTLASGNTVTYRALAGGIQHAIKAKRVWATGTTATLMLAVY